MNTLCLPDRTLFQSKTGVPVEFAFTQQIRGALEAWRCCLLGETLRERRALSTGRRR